MGKRGRPRKDQTQENSSVKGAPSQKSQQQETMAYLLSGKVKKMKLEPKVGHGSALGFASSKASPSRPQTRNYLKAVIDQCEFKTATPRSPVRHVKASYPSSATCDFPAQETPSFPEVENTATVSKEAKAINLVVIETKMKEREKLKEELAALQERLRKKEDERGIAQCEYERIMQRIADSKAKFNALKGFLMKSLVRDLL